MVLFNASFAATNERAGAEIAHAIVRALLEAAVRVGFVTDSFELSNSFYREAMAGAMFLRAERRGDGQRTFRQIEGEPLPTCYGEDLYRLISMGAERPHQHRRPHERRGGSFLRP